MRRVLTTLFFAGFASTALAGPQCTTEPKDNWLGETEMRVLIQDLGYTIDVFKTTGGNCYEIYGRTAEGKRVEVYFHPISGDVMKVEEL